MYRYLAVLWDRRNLESVKLSQPIRATLAAQPTEWLTAYEGPEAIIVHTGARSRSAKAFPLARDRGVILGNLFDGRHANYVERPAIAFDERETGKILTSKGRHLVECYWGSYVAFLFDNANEASYVIREPLANIPCYHLEHGGLHVFFSHITDCLRSVPYSFRTNRRYLSHWLLFSGFMSRECALDNVEDVPGGERISISQGRVSRALIWNPIEIASKPRVDAPGVAANQLRTTVQNTVDAWASCYQNIVHKLSGGIDSSIVAACLAHAPSNPKIAYLNFSVDEGFDEERLYMPGVEKRLADKIRAISGRGDERYFARLLADRYKTALIEKQRSTSIDLGRSRHAPLMVNPPMFFTAMEVDDAEIELATTHGTQAFFSGQGGDSVFLATVQPLAAIDYMHMHKFKSGLWQQLVTTSILSKESVWSVFGKTLWHGLLRRPYHSPISMVQQPTLLTTELLHTIHDKDFHTIWAELASSLPPGKQNHVEGLGGSAYYEYVFHSGEYADHVDPLNSQPIWELMLQIPTFTILAGGVSRGLARRAFADALPDEIRKRQVKGTGTPFYQQLVRRNRTFLRETLADGLLVRDGYLDRRKLLDYLDADEPFITVRASQLLSYFAAEIWLQQWSCVASTQASPTSDLKALAL